MSRVIGIDLGSYTSVVAFTDAATPKVATLANNEVSKISTPSMVSFGEKRYGSWFS